MLKILIPVDGSENSTRAIDYLIAWLPELKDVPDIHLVNVQHAVHGEVSLFVGSDQIRSFHHDEGSKALTAARERLDAASIPYCSHIGVGDPAEVIVHYSKEKACDQIIMSTRGVGDLASLLLGSVTHSIIQKADIPVLLVK
ncbi:MAG: universal stress protein [Methylococcaceae bacterium]|jgi:nucleotide-binding universal stress UspA family protein